jgi:8-hydroxy-5-deazaflavin:NADPH oxidoreductase
VIERVAVIGGTGEQGFGLAVRWTRAGIECVIGSRDEGRAEAAARRILELVPDGRVRGLDNAAAAAAATAVVVAVPFAGQAAIYRSIAPALRDESVVVDCTVPLAAAVGGRPTQVLGVWQGSAAQQGASLLERGTLCAAFHSLSAATLRDLDAVLEGDVLACGPGEAKPVVVELTQALPGLRFIDAGPLAAARLVEPITALLVGLNRRYKVHGAGVRITGLPDATG